MNEQEVTTAEIDRLYERLGREEEAAAEGFDSLVSLKQNDIYENGPVGKHY